MFRRRSPRRIAVAGVALVVGATAIGHHVVSRPVTTIQACYVSTSGPDPRCTPGATNPAVTQRNLRSTICKPGWTATIRPSTNYTNRLKRQQLDAYGFSDKDLSHYEEDHLISLELGGAPKNPKNLWPEPGGAAHVPLLIDGTDQNSLVKDAYENRLHDEVCAGQITLRAAQAAIARDWYANSLR